MRRVNELIWTALKMGSYCKASTNTWCDSDGNVFLFSKHIARCVPSAARTALSSWEFNLQGYHTVTTLDRLNALMVNITGWSTETSLIWWRHGTAYRGPRGKAMPVPCPRGVDQKAHGALHYTDDEAVPVPDGWFSAVRTAL